MEVVGMGVASQWGQPGRVASRGRWEVWGQWVVLRGALQRSAGQNGGLLLQQPKHG